MGYGFFRTSGLDEQDLVDKIAKFLVNTIGWSVVDDLANTATDRRVVLSSPGEQIIGNPNLVYIELRGTSNYIYLSTYETYTDSVTYTGLLEDATYGRVTANTQMWITCVADLERVAFTLTDASSNSYSGYAGRITSYYKPSEHPYPNLIKGNTSTSYNYFYTGAQRNMWMFRADGVKGAYYPLEVTDSTDYPSYLRTQRSDKTFMAAIPVYYSLDASFYEIAGELRGIYHLSGESSGLHAYYEFDGKIYVTANQSSGNTVDFIMGPIADVGDPLIENPYTYWQDPLV